MHTLELSRSPGRVASNFNGTLRIALLASFPVIGLDQFLHTSPGDLVGSWAFQSLHWVSDALLALPLAVAAVWAGQRIANRAGLVLPTASNIFAQACLIALIFALALIPGWFGHDEIDRLTQTQNLVSAHSHGHDEVHWAGGAVIYTLILIPLGAGAVLAGLGVMNLFRLRPVKKLFTRTCVIVLLLAVALAADWLLVQAANQADASQVSYTSALLSVHVHSHGFFGHHTHPSSVSASSPVTGAPFAFAYQVAHAIQDGLVGQAIGLPVIFMTLLWRARRQRPRQAAS